MYLFININQYFATHPCGIIRNVEWTLKTLYWRCNEINLTSRISYTDSSDRRLFECSNWEFFLWCEVLHWFGVSSTLLCCITSLRSLHFVRLLKRMIQHNKQDKNPNLLVHFKDTESGLKYMPGRTFLIIII